jgi:mono/diheme cytochrome c family protein
MTTMPPQCYAYRTDSNFFRQYSEWNDMTHRNNYPMKANRAFSIATGAAAAIVIAGAAALAFSQPAAATVQFAKDTGKSCADCHTNPKGGGALTPLGTQFKANGNKMPASPASG